ncbi:MAG: hypothetical protein DYH08_12105 [Actinobacteria bacterium ATB1]|nr:hypothetical protein [Actinobacteria bacterium ATB1]
MPRTCPECGWVWPNPRGACPNCGSDSAAEIDLSGNETGVAQKKARMPVSLMILAVAFAIYLGVRIVQGIVWLTGRF